MQVLYNAFWFQTPPPILKEKQPFHKHLAHISGIAVTHLSTIFEDTLNRASVTAFNLMCERESLRQAEMIRCGEGLTASNGASAQTSNRSTGT